MAGDSKTMPFRNSDFLIYSRRDKTSNSAEVILTFLKANEEVCPPLHSLTGIRLRWIPIERKQPDKKSFHSI